MSEGYTERCQTSDGYFGSSTVHVTLDSYGAAIISQSYQPSGNMRAVYLTPAQVAYVLGELSPRDSRPVRPHGEGGRA